MTKLTMTGLLVLGVAFANHASAQYPAAPGYPTAPSYAAPPAGYAPPSYPAPAGAPVGSPYGAPQTVYPAGQPVGGPVMNGGPIVGGQVVGGPVVGGGHVVGGPVVGGGHVVGGPVVGGGQVVGGAVPYGEDFGNGPQGLGYPGVISNGGGDEELYPYDQQDPWLHGYWQEIPAYGGYSHFRPYNYKHVLSQTQTAAGWGLDPKMPYSQQFWHRYQERAALEHCPLPARALAAPNAETDPRDELDRLRREMQDRQRRIDALERNEFNR